MRPLDHHVNALSFPVGFLSYHDIGTQKVHALGVVRIQAK